MKALIFSDSHGKIAAMQRAWRMHAADTDAVFFLGDGYRDLELLRPAISVPLYAVQGNNDFYCDFPQELTVEFDGKRIFLTHGHRYYAKSGKGHLIRQGIALGADAVLFGHTHVAQVEYWNEAQTNAKPLYLFGCGSIGLPNDGKPTYGILQTYQGQIDLHHALIERL